MACLSRIAEYRGMMWRPSRRTKRRVLRPAIYILLLCTAETFSAGALQAQRSAPAGVQRSSDVNAASGLTSSVRMTVRRSPSDSGGGGRAEHAVVGAAIGAVVGVVVGYERGKAADARCGSGCGGPAIGRVILPPLYGFLGGAIGAVVGFVFPT
jgi:hypothetical protein